MERTPEEISLLELIEAIDGPMTSTLPLNEGLPADSKSKLELAMMEVTAMARRELEGIRLSHLLPQPIFTGTLRTPVAVVDACEASLEPVLAST